MILNFIHDLVATYTQWSLAAGDSWHGIVLEDIALRAEPISTGAAIGLFIASVVISYAQQSIQQRKAKEEQKKRQGLLVRPSGSGLPIPILYGWANTPGIRVYVNTYNALYEEPDFENTNLLPKRARVFFGAERIPDGSRKYLLSQHVIACGEIDDVVNFWADDQPSDKGKLRHHCFTSWQHGGTPEPYANMFFNGPKATSVFTGLTFATNVFRFNRKEPNFNSIPEPRYFVKGNRLYDPRKSAHSQTDKTTWEFSNNAALVLLNYLTQGTYGLKWKYTDIDLESFKTAADVCGEVVQGTDNVFSAGILYPEEYGGTGDTDYNVNFIRQGLAFAPNLNELARFISGASDRAVSYTNTQTPDQLYRYEFNGAIDTAVAHKENIEIILGVIPGVEFFRSPTGQWKLKIPNSMDSARVQAASKTSTDSNGVVTVLETHLIDEDDLITGIEITYPDPTDIYNALDIKFSNINKDFAEDTAIYPEPGSTLYTDIRRDDNELYLNDQIEIEGIVDKYHAYAAAGNLIAMSHRQTYSFVTRFKGFIHEPGDIIQLRDKRVSVGVGSDFFIKVIKTEVKDDLTIAITGVAFNKNDYGWALTHLDLITSFDDLVVPLGAPQNLTAVARLSRKDILLTWEPPNPEKITIQSYHGEVLVNDPSTGDSERITGPSVSITPSTEITGTTYGSTSNYTSDATLPLSQTLNQRTIAFAYYIGSVLTARITIQASLNSAGVITTTRNRAGSFVVGYSAREVISSDGTTATISFRRTISGTSTRTFSGARDTAKEFATTGNTQPKGLYSDGTTMWIASQSNRSTLFAHVLATGARDSSKDFTSLSNNDATGMYSDGTTLWIANYRITSAGTFKIYAYVLATMATDTSKDITLASGSSNPVGIWSDGTTMWVGQSRRTSLSAYNLVTQDRDTTKERFTNLRGSTNPDSIWSDGTTMWIGDPVRDRIDAYVLATGAADSSKDITVATGNNDPTGMWGVGNTLYVADRADGEIYAYTLFNTATTQPVETVVQTNTLTVTVVDSEEAVYYTSDATLPLSDEFNLRDITFGYPSNLPSSNYVTLRAILSSSSVVTVTRFGSLFQAGVTAAKTTSSDGAVTTVTFSDSTGIVQTNILTVSNLQGAISWEAIGSTQYANRQLTYLPLSIGMGRYKFRVRAAASGGRFGPWSTVSAEISVESLIGTDGRDGYGIEDIFIINMGALPTLPSNDWAFDSPEDDWMDGADAGELTIDNDTLWRSQRDLSGNNFGDNEIAILSDWTAPLIVRTYIAGQSGEDGNGVEYIFGIGMLVGSEDMVPTPLPDNAWTFDVPDPPSGRTDALTGDISPQIWTDGRGLGVQNPDEILYRSTRSVQGTPEVGAVVYDPTDDEKNSVLYQWSTPAVVGRYIRGQEGEDGFSYEFVYRATPHGDASQIPDVGSGPTFAAYGLDRTWIFDSPGNGWLDEAPDLTSTNTTLWRSNRRIKDVIYYADDDTDTTRRGTIQSATALGDGSWSVPRRIGRFGLDGAKGEKGDSGDGSGFEDIFRITNQGVAPPTPLRIWVFNSPRLGWTDGISRSLLPGEVVYRSTRSTTAVNGVVTPQPGTAGEWSTPAIVGSYIVGQRGEDGEAAGGFEYIFYTNSAILNSTTNELEDDTPDPPSNNWTFDNPDPNTFTTHRRWHDGAESLSAVIDTLWRTRRKVIGSPSRGAIIPALWETPPVVVGRWVRGQRGVDGAVYESIYTASATDTLLDDLRTAYVRLPSGSWRYLAGGTTASGQVWSRVAPATTVSPVIRPYLLVSTRYVAPVDGLAVVAGGVVPNNARSQSGEWSAPTVVSKYGSDTNGFEYVFRLRASTTRTDGSPHRGPVHSSGQIPEIPDSTTLVDLVTRVNLLRDSGRTGQITPDGLSRNTNGFIPIGWSDNPLELTDAQPYQYVSFRKTPGGGVNKFGSWSVPVIYNQLPGITDAEVAREEERDEATANNSSGGLFAYRKSATQLATPADTAVNILNPRPPTTLWHLNFQDAIGTGLPDGQHIYATNGMFSSTGSGLTSSVGFVYVWSYPYIVTSNQGGYQFRSRGSGGGTTPDPGTTTLTISYPTLTTITQYNSISLTPTTTGKISGRSYVYSHVGTLVDGVTFNSTTGVIAGTTNARSAGRNSTNNQNIQQVRITDSDNSSINTLSSAFYIEVTPVAPSFSYPATNNAVIGLSYSLSPIIGSRSGPVRTGGWTQDPTGNQNGLTVDADTGVIRTTSDTGNEIAGSARLGTDDTNLSTFEITATGPTRLNSSHDVVITIRNVVAFPEDGGPVPQVLQKDVAASISFPRAVGGMPFLSPAAPYTYKVLTGGANASEIDPPLGLMLDGEDGDGTDFFGFTGTPTVPQAETSYHIQVTDSTGHTNEFSFTIEVEGSATTVYMAGRTRSRLYTLSTTDFSATQVGSLGEGFGVTPNEDSPQGLAFIGSTLYMAGTTTNSLYILNRTTGAAILIGSLGVLSPVALASIGTTLYMLDRTASAAGLYTVNIGNGTATRVGTVVNFGTLGLTAPRGLAVLNGILYMVDATARALYTVSRSSGIATRVGTADRFQPLSTSPGRISAPVGLTTIDDTLYLLSSSPDAVYTLDETTGIATLAGSGFSSIETNPTAIAATDTLISTGTTNVITIDYPSTITLPEDMPFDNISPSITGSITAWSVSPDLPAGMDLTTATGDIVSVSGGPTTPQTATNYTITATGPSEVGGMGSGASTEDSFTITITETEVTPGLSIPSNQTVYLAEASSNSLYTLDTTTYSATLVGAYGIPMRGVNFSKGLAFIGSTLHMVATPDPGRMSLYTVNRTSGLANLIGSSGISRSTISQATGLTSIVTETSTTLYSLAAQGIATLSFLFTVNPMTGATAMVGSGSLSVRMAGLAAIGTTLYGVTNTLGSGALYTISTSNASTIRIGTATNFGIPGLTRPTGLMAIGNTLYMTTSTSLYAVNTTTGTAVLLGGSFVGISPSAIAATNTPEPTITLQISYSEPSISVVSGSPILSVEPTVTPTGTTSWSISDASTLSDRGITINATSGVISGMSRGILTEQDFTVTATRADFTDGTTTVSIGITGALTLIPSDYTVYAVSRTFIYTLNRTTLVAERFGSSVLASDVTANGLTFIGSTLYMVGSGNRQHRLFTVSRTSGIATPIAILGLFTQALASIGTTLYFVSNSTLHSVSTTGTVATIGNLTISGDNDGLAAIGTTLYGTFSAGNSHRALYTISTSTGMAVRVGTATNYGYVGSHIQPSALMAINNTLYAVHGERLYTLSTTTGIVTLLDGNIGTRGILGMAATNTLGPINPDPPPPLPTVRLEISYPTYVINLVSGTPDGSYSDAPTITPTGSTSWSISNGPALGLADIEMNSGTGVIGGSNISGNFIGANFGEGTVTASRAGFLDGTTTVRVELIAPTTLAISYSASGQSVISGANFDSGTPTVTPTGATTFRIQLSDRTLLGTHGIFLNNNTGQISGTTSGILTSRNFTVIAIRNGFATGTTTFSIGILAVPAPILPPIIAYSLTVAVVEEQYAVLPTNSGGTPSVYALYSTVGPSRLLDFPAGVLFDEASGLIYTGLAGPTAPFVESRYVQASNSAGSHSVLITLTCVASGTTPQLSLTISYSNSTLTAVQGSRIDSVRPTISPSAAFGLTIWSISSSTTLASYGVSISPGTGVISGLTDRRYTLTEQDFTVTATRAGYTAGTTTVSIEITAAASTTPTLLISYSPSSLTVVDGDYIESNNPTDSAVGAVAWSISSASTLSDHGITINATSGVISGTSRGILTEQDFTVRATSSGFLAGTTTVSIEITAAPSTPPGPVPNDPLISYADITGVTGTPITSRSPANGSTYTSFEVNPVTSTDPSLTSYGLMFSRTTGTISGTANTAILNKQFRITSHGGTDTEPTLSVAFITINITVDSTNPPDPTPPIVRAPILSYGPLDTTTGRGTNILTAIGRSGSNSISYNPRITGGGLVNSEASQPYIVRTPASTYGSIPSGFSLNRRTGVISGRRTTPVSQSFTIQVSGPGGNFSVRVTLNVESTTG